MLPLLSRCQLGKTEIENFCLGRVSHKNVCGLDVAVRNSPQVGGVQCVGDLNGQLEDSIDPDRLALDLMF